MDVNLEMLVLAGVFLAAGVVLCLAFLATAFLIRLAHDLKGLLWKRHTTK